MLVYWMHLPKQRCCHDQWLKCSLVGGYKIEIITHARPGNPTSSPFIGWHSDQKIKRNFPTTIVNNYFSFVINRIQWQNLALYWCFFHQASDRELLWLWVLVKAPLNGVTKLISTLSRMFYVWKRSPPKGKFSGATGHLIGISVMCTNILPPFHSLNLFLSANAPSKV